MTIIAYFERAKKGNSGKNLDKAYIKGSEKTPK
jgi:hypothetical protein